MASDREEVSAGRIRQGLGGGRPWRNSSDGLARDVRDVAAADAEVVKFAVRQPVQLADRLAEAAPVAIVADEVHGILVSSSFVLFSSYLAKIGAPGQLLKRSCCIAAMQIVHCTKFSAVADVSQK